MKEAICRMARHGAASVAGLSCVALIACSTAPKIVPLDSGTVKDITPLAQLTKDKHKVVIVFLHGVGDHCPGYALKGPDAWTRGAAFTQLRIRGNRGAEQTFTTPMSVDRGSGQAQVAGDGTPLGDLVTREVQLGELGQDKIPVYGVEITWSELTWRLKTKNLNYDFTQAGAQAYARELSQAGMDCFKPFPEDAAQTREAAAPPARATINRKIKEDLLDRALSDAMLYSGAFKEVLQRAVAKGLCDAILMTSTPARPTASNASECWVSAQTALADSEQNTLYLFVTHSLGSRMLYDVLRNLGGINQYYDNPFTNASDSSAAKGVKQLVCQTGAIYMMANQLPLLGLAAGGTLRDAIADDPLTESQQAPANLMQNEPVRPASATTRLECPRSPSRPPKPLFVAFMDTNDLLSWGIRPGMDHSSFDFLTVYVNNTRWHWLGLYEDGAVAHSGYFKNPTVGQLIACGSDKGQMQPCAGMTPR
jgi:hypothetical protein